MKIRHNYVEASPNKQTVYLDGLPINLTRLSADLSMDRSYLSRILSGERTPSVPLCMNIAAALNMSVESFMAAVESRTSKIST